jgi:hypothetical protein
LGRGRGRGDCGAELRERGVEEGFGVAPIVAVEPVGITPQLVWCKVEMWRVLNCEMNDDICLSCRFDISQGIHDR